MYGILQRSHLAGQVVRGWPANVHGQWCLASGPAQGDAENERDVLE